jgi:hypothetical protein
VEQIDELSPKTMTSYIEKSKKDRNNTASDYYSGVGDSDADFRGMEKRIDKRSKGIRNANRSIAKTKKPGGDPAMKEEAEQVDEISGKTAFRAMGKALNKAQQAGDEGDVKLDDKRMKQATKFGQYSKKKYQFQDRIRNSRRNPFMKKEDVELDEISQKTKDSYVAKRGSQLSSMMHGPSKNYNLLSGKKQAKAVKGIKQALNKEEVELDEISKETAWKATEKAHTKVTKSAYGAIGDREPYLSKFKKNLKQEKKFSDYYKKKKEMGEANLTPYRNTELGVRSSKRAGQPRASNSRQFFRPPEGFTKKGIEKGKGKITVPVYKKKK